jgi:peptidoglycan/LPS O-acetylase OafA/YrhL
MRWAGVPEDTAYFLLPTRCDALGVGMLIAVAYRRENWWPKLAAVAPWCAPFLALATFQFQRHSAVASYTIFAAFYGCLLVCALPARDTLVSRFFASRPMRLLGTLSYCTYMLHHIVMRYCFYFLLHKDPVVSSLGDLLPDIVALPVVLAVCTASWSWFEKPIMKWGHRQKYASRVEAGAVA